MEGRPRLYGCAVQMPAAEDERPGRVGEPAGTALEPRRKEGLVEREPEGAAQDVGRLPRREPNGVSRPELEPERQHVELHGMVRMIGLEPTLPCGNWNLNPARLPISPHPRALRAIIACPTLKTGYAPIRLSPPHQ